MQVSYPGASARRCRTPWSGSRAGDDGIDNLRYISSESNSDGSMTITVTFEQGTDPDIAQVQVQNKRNWPPRYCRRKCSARGSG